MHDDARQRATDVLVAYLCIRCRSRGYARRRLVTVSVKGTILVVARTSSQNIPVHDQHCKPHCPKKISIERIQSSGDLPQLLATVSRSHDQVLSGEGGTAAHHFLSERLKGLCSVVLCSKDIFCVEHTSRTHAVMATA